MLDPWHILGLENSVLKRDEGEIRFARMDPGVAISVRRILGYSSCEHCGDQPPIMVEDILFDDDGIRIDNKGTRVAILWPKIQASGTIPLNKFLEFALLKLQEKNEKTKPTLMWTEEDGIHTLDGGIFTDPLDAIEHALELSGKEISESDRFRIHEMVALMRGATQSEGEEEKGGSPGTPSPEKKKDAVGPSPAAPASPAENGGKKRAAPAAPPQPKKKSQKAKKPGGKCGGCGGSGHLMVNAIHETYEIPEVQRCDACAVFESDHDALVFAISRNIDSVFAHLGIPLQETCEDRPMFKVGQTPGHCINSPELCFTCTAKYIEGIQEKKIKSLEGDEDEDEDATNKEKAKDSPNQKTKGFKRCHSCNREYNPTMSYGCPSCDEQAPPGTCFYCRENYMKDGAHGTILGKPACVRCIGLEKAGKLPDDYFWDCKCDVDYRHGRIMDTRCHRCGMVSPGRKTIEKKVLEKAPARAAPSAPIEGLNCEECGCECSGCFEGSSTGDYSKCNRYEHCLRELREKDPDYATAEDEKGIADMVHGSPDNENNLLGWACAGCMKFWVPDQGDPDPTPEARRFLEEHDDEVHGGCRPTWVPVFKRMVDDEGKILPGDHYTLKPVILADEASNVHGIKISKEAIEELKGQVKKQGGFWLPSGAELARFPCGEASCKTGANAAFGCVGCKENKLYNKEPFKIKEEDLKIDRKLARKVTGVLTSNKFWDCECKEDFCKPKAMVRCVKCKAVQEDCPDSKLRELNEFQLLIAKEEKIDFSSWTDDDMEIFLIEAAMGLKHPFCNSSLMAEMVKYGMDLDKAMALSTGAWQTEGHFAGNDSSKLFVTLTEWDNYDIQEQKVTVKPCLDCGRPVNPERRAGRCEQCDILFQKESEEKSEPLSMECPECHEIYVDEDGCTAATDEKTCIKDHGRCRACQRKWALSPAPQEKRKEEPKKAARASGAKKKRMTVEDLPKGE